MSNALPFDPTNKAFLANPYPTYEMLRRDDPVHWCAMDSGFWVVTRYEDVALVLRDARFGIGDFWAAQEPRLGSGPAFRNSSTWMVFKDPPDHTRLRRLMSKVFTPKAVEQMRPRIEAMVAELLAGPLSKGEMDVIAELAFPLPVYVIADMLGVAAEDRREFHAWTQAMNLIFEPVLGAEQIRTCNDGIEKLEDYFRSVLAQRRRNPRDDLLTALAQVEESGDQLSEEELIGNAVLLLSAGYETTMGLIGNAILSLLENPVESGKLLDRPDLIQNAVEEALRYNSPIQYALRWALEDVELRGRHIKKGDRVFPIVGSANRDPSRFERPNEFHVDRADIDQLSFGGGRHFCIGAPLARLEGEVVLRTLVPHLVRARIHEEKLEWRSSYLNHALERLRVRFSE